MNPSPSPSAVPAAVPDRPGRVLRAVTIAACVPYLALKAAWIAGSRAGIPAGSTLLEHRTTMIVANAVTVLMDSAVIVLALLLTRPWGRRVPAWLLAVPAWVATGLLAPIMAGFPLELLVSALRGEKHTASSGAPFLADWVFAVVYTGFIVQGLCLGALFVRYARDRWGRLWRGRVGELPDGALGAAQRLTAGTAALFGLLPLAAHLLWLSGATAGLSPGRAGGRDASFYVMEALYVVFLAAAVAGGTLTAFRRGRALPVAVPLALAWVGSAATACWGGWLATASVTAVENIAERPTPLMDLTYAAHMIVGLLTATAGAHFLTERAARERAAENPGAPGAEGAGALGTEDADGRGTVSAMRGTGEADDRAGAVATGWRAGAAARPEAPAAGQAGTATASFPATVPSAVAAGPTAEAAETSAATGSAATAATGRPGSAAGSVPASPAGGAGRGSGG
ncbi:hypothetical protein AB0907_40590 [Streptomyces sp. NPDC006975]|uniref:hypothetical protein n=1 Tax=Streptomyces sp. NPDC006975 TaxID=3154310 RepID=UPI00345295BB